MSITEECEDQEKWPADIYGWKVVVKRKRGLAYRQQYLCASDYFQDGMHD
jgi:hypothetical protein